MIHIMDAEKARQSAEHLFAHRVSHAAISRLPPNCRAETVADGYQIQAALHRLMATSDLGPIGGSKIGCTTPVMQAFLGIDQACAGGIPLSTCLPSTPANSPLRLDHTGYRKLGVECEIAVTLATDLPASGRPYTEQQVYDAVDGVMMAFELVDDRYADYQAFGIAHLIADDFFNAGAIFGPACPRPDFPEFATLQGEMWINGQHRGRGYGRDVMGHPMTALNWLANGYPEACGPLRAGHRILLGSLVQTQWLAAGDSVSAKVPGLGELHFDVS